MVKVLLLEGPQTHLRGVLVYVLSQMHQVRACYAPPLSPCPAGREVEAGQRHGVGVDGVGRCLSVRAHARLIITTVTGTGIL